MAIEVRIHPTACLHPDDKPIASAMGAVKWRHTQRAHRLTAAALQTLFRIKARKLSTWNFLRHDQSYAHGPVQKHSSITMHHMLWSCLMAQVRWDITIRRWEVTGARFDNPIHAVFGHKLPSMPTEVAALFFDGGSRRDPRLGDTGSLSTSMQAGILRSGGSPAWRMPPRYH